MRLVGFMSALFVCVLVLSLNIYLGHDTDNDGVKDSLDQCPNTAQLHKVADDFIYALAVNPERLKSGTQAVRVNFNGCESDSDKDGVVDSQDYCPNDTPLMLSRGVADNGCPVHSDQDGTPDYRDNCPDTPPGVSTDRYGCPI